MNFFVKLDFIGDKAISVIYCSSVFKSSKSDKNA